MDIKLLTLNIIFGSVVIYTYFRYLGGALQKGITSNQLWADIRGNYRNLYYLSMLLSTISYLYLLYYLVKNQKGNKIVYTGTLIFFIGASLWAPFLYSYFVNKINKVFIYLSLCLTTVGIILLSIYLMSKGNFLSKICISIFLFHILILDNLIWSIKFQKI